MTHSPELVDTGTVSAFLKEVHAPALAAGVPGRIVVSKRIAQSGSKRKYVSWSYPVAEHAAAAAACWRISDSGANAFVRCHLIDRAISDTERGTGEDTRWITHYAADVDIAGPGHVSTDLPEDLDEALAIIDSSVEPSLVVSSGGGLYPIWMLSEVVEVADADTRERVRNIGRRIDAALRRCGRHVDSTAMDLTRIIRPPGVMNCKANRSPMPVTVLRGIAAGGGRYHLDELDRLLPPLPDGKVSARKARSADRGGTRTESTTRSGDDMTPWAIYERRYTLAQVLALDPTWTWERVDDVHKEETWRRTGSSSEYSIRRRSSDGAIKVWSSTVAERLGVEPGDALDLYGFALRLAGRDPATAGKQVTT